ncbi:MAG TPA: A24 family peptidase, partial [Bacillota bacterium]|nr:A24 family peptidase [Bacillota bacterium]
SPYINSLLNALLGAVSCGGFLLLLAELSNGGMGGGDIKFMAAAGAYLGWYGAFMVLLLGSILGIIATMALLRMKRMNKGELIPFGPYLAAAGIILANTSLYLRIFY